MTAPRKRSHKVRNIALAVIIGLGAFTTLVVIDFLSCKNCEDFTPSPQVSIASIGCTGTSNTTCSAELVNAGAAGTQVLYASVTFGGRSLPGTCPQLTLPAGSSTNVECTFPVTPGVPGQEFTGFIATSNGAQVPFTGAFGAASGG